MTKIKNTKKGMAKKTLSMSLVVAMLATSNVPVWAAEFSDGSDASVAVETPATETFSDEAAETPVAENEEAVSAEATTNNKFNATVKFKKGSSDFTDKSVKWNVADLSAEVTVSAGEESTANIYAIWMVDGKQIGTNATGITSLDTPISIPAVQLNPKMADAGSKITLYIYAEKAGETVWRYTSDPISVEKIDINDVVNTTNATTDVRIDNVPYDGKKHTVTKSSLNIGSSLKADWTEDDFTIGDVIGDTENVTDDGVTVTLVPTKSGYTGVLTRKYKITPLTLTSSNIGEYIKAEVVNTSVAYTGKTIAPKNTDVKLTDKKTGADLSGYIKDVVGIATADGIKAGKSHNLIINLNSSSEGTVKNYTIGKGLTVTTENKLSITQRNLNTVDIQIEEIPSSTPYTLQTIKYYDKTTKEELKLDNEVAFDTSAINGAGTYTVKATANSQNVTGETTAIVRVADTSLRGATFKNDYARADEEYTGEQIVKDITKLGDVYIGNKKILPENYKIEFGTNINAGTGVIRIVGQNSYKNSVAEVPFNIKKAVVSADTITYNKLVEGKDTQEASAYKNAVGLVVKAKNAKGKEFTLTEGTDYTVSYSIGTDSDGDSAVKTVIKLKDDGNYVLKAGFTGTSSKITNKMIKDADIRLKQTSYTYTGAGITPKYDVVVDGRILNPATDYEVVSVSKNVNVGTATLEIKGKSGSNYSDKATAKATFSIVAADASKLTGAIASQPYTGYAINPAPSQIDLTLDGVKINVNDNFTLSYGENINIGEGTVTLTPKNGNFTGTKTITFKISGKMLKGGALEYYKADGLKDSLSKKYDGKEIKAAKTVFNTTHTTLNEKTLSDKLTEGTDYEIKYVDNVYGKTINGKQYGFVLVVAKGNYAGNYSGDTVTDGIYTDAAGNKITNVIVADKFEITKQDMVRTNVSVKNGTYAAGLLVKPSVVITVNGRTLVEGTDYDLDFAGNKDLVNATEKNSLTVTVEPKNGYQDGTGVGANLTFKWGIDKFNLSNADVSVKDGNVTVKCGSITVPSADYTVTKDAAADKVTVTAAKDSKNYTGSKTVSADVAPAEKPDAPMISNVKVVGNKATVILSGEASDAAGYDYVISTDRDCITNKAYDGVSKNQATTSTSFKYVQQGTYYAYCHAWKRDENGKKVFSDWSNAYPFVVSAITPDAPVITNVKVNGTTIKVTYKAAANATGYDVVLGTGSKKENGETRPYQYGNHKKLNLKEGTVTATFKNVPKGTWVVGMHAFNRTSEDGKKVFSPWSNLKKATVR